MSLWLANAWGFVSLHKKILGYLALVLIVFGVFLYATDRVGNWWNERGIDKDKAKIANTIGNIANINAQISNLEIQKAEQQGELKKDTETLTNSVYGREEAKKEVNAALANFNRALNTNTGVDATAEQIQEALDKLK